MFTVGQRVEVLDSLNDYPLITLKDHSVLKVKDFPIKKIMSTFATSDYIVGFYMDMDQKPKITMVLSEGSILPYKQCQCVSLLFGHESNCPFNKKG